MGNIAVDGNRITVASFATVRSNGVLLMIAAPDSYIASRRYKPFGHSQSDASIASCNTRDLPFQIHHFQKRRRI